MAPKVMRYAKLPSTFRISIYKWKRVRHMFVHLISIDWSAVDDVVNQACRQQPQIQACLVTWHLRRRVRQTKSLSSPVTAVVGARIHSTVSARRRRHKGRQAGGQFVNLSIVSSKQASERTDHAHRLTTCTAAAAAARYEPVHGHLHESKVTGASDQYAAVYKLQAAAAGHSPNMLLSC